jgi:hypothetical protein
MHPDGAFVFEVLFKMFLYYAAPPLLVIGIVLLAVWAHRRGPPSDPQSKES